MIDENESKNDPLNDPQLTAYAMGELSADEARGVEQLIAASPELATVVDEIRATIVALEGAFAGEQPLELSEQQKAAIALASNSSDQRSAEGATSVARPEKDVVAVSSRPWGRWLLAAAIGTVLIGGGVFLANPDGQLGRQAAQNEDGVGKSAGFKTDVQEVQSAKAAAPLSAAMDDSIGENDFASAKELVQSTIDADAWDEDAPVDIDEIFAAETTLELTVSQSQSVQESLEATLDETKKETLAMEKSLRSKMSSLSDAGGGGASGQGRFAAKDLERESASKLMMGRRVEGGIGGAPAAAPAPTAGLAKKFSGMPEGSDGNEELEMMEMEMSTARLGRSDIPSVNGVSVGDAIVEFPDAEEWLEQRNHRARFSRARLNGAYQDVRGVVGQLTLDDSQTKQTTNSFLDDLLDVDGDNEADEGKRGESGTFGSGGGKSSQPAKSTLQGEEEKKQEELQKKATKTWKRVKAIPNTTRLMVGDKEELDLTGMQVNVQVDGFRARVLIDYLYYNDRKSQLEGNFKLRLPEDSSLYYFAFGESANELTPRRRLARREFADNGTRFVSFTPAAITKSRSDVWRNVKEARMVPREQAAYAFRETVRRRVDPALVEWSGAGVFNAKVFPLAPKKVHRIVIGYDVNLTRSGNQLTYQLDLPESTGDCRIEVNAQDVEGIQYKIEPEVEPVEVDHNDELHQRFTFDQRPENGIRLTATTELPLLLKSKELADEFWATQITPELPVQESVGSGRAMFMLDTSLSSSPDKFNVWLKMLETTLANNRDTMKEFGVLMFSVDGHFWKPKYVANSADNVTELKGTLENLVLEGATDLYAAIQKVTMTDWVVDGQAPDLFLLSDGAANWGETNQRLIGSLLADKKTGSLFAYQTGMTGTAIANLRFLAGQTGGAVFSVASEDEVATASRAHRKRPWKLSAISAEGATDVMTAGRVEWIYPGQTLTVVGRGVVSGPMKLEFEQSGKTTSVSATPRGIVSELAGRLYGQISVGQLESLGSEVFDISAAYARHFRVTGGTCSLLMLESEADYERFEIKPEEDEFVIKSKPASKLVADMLEKAASRLANPKAQLLSWLKRLETMQGLSFTMPTALKLAIDDINVVAVSRPLDCTVISRGDVSKGYLSALNQESLDYDVIAGQAKKRGRQSVDDSIKVFSSLIERNPGDVTMARDVAFTALELDRPAQAYHLLRSVARQRPFQGSVYPAIGQCLAQAGQADMAIVYYEVALAGEFQRQGSKFRQIVAVDYMHLLRRIVSGKAKSSVVDFARARLETLTKKMPVSKADMLVTMMWNQDETDVDLHVIEPSGEECFYSHKTTKSGGEITDDITTGFGPEMYFNQRAPEGKYKIAVKFFGNSRNRTSVKNKVYLTVLEGFGSDQEKVTRRTIRLKDTGEHRTVMEVER